MVSLMPLALVAEMIRAIVHILLLHPHPILWMFMMGAGIPIVGLWHHAIQAVSAASHGRMHQD